MTFDRSPASDLWRHTLSQIPTTFGRLVFLASLRDPNTGAYAHYGFAHRVGEEAAGAVNFADYSADNDYSKSEDFSWRLR